MLFEQCQHADLLMNGPSSDMFSAGVVLFEQLTGVLPFLPVEHVERSVPDSVPEHARKRWREYEAMSQAHHVWVSMEHQHDRVWYVACSRAFRHAKHGSLVVLILRLCPFVLLACGTRKSCVGCIRKLGLCRILWHLMTANCNLHSIITISI